MLIARPATIVTARSCIVVIGLILAKAGKKDVPLNRRDYVHQLLDGGLATFLGDIVQVQYNASEKVNIEHGIEL